jgi:cytochrome c-type biogenesis protein CcmH/NrfG
MASNDVKALVEEGTFQFTIGENAEALTILRQATTLDPECFEAWHALAEVALAERHLDDALQAAENALKVQPENLFIHTTLSRIWMERGDKAAAERHGARAKILGWKDELRPPSEPPFTPTPFR